MNFRRLTLCFAVALAIGSTAHAEDYGNMAPSPLWGGNRYQDDQAGPRAPSPQWGSDDFRNRQDQERDNYAPSPNWGATRY